MGCLKIEDIKSSVSILDVCAHYGIDLIKSGGITYKRRDNPSFTIYSDTNRFKDFGGDGSSGDIVDFVCQIEGCGITEAKAKLTSLFIGDVSNIQPLKIEAPKVTNNYDTPQIIEAEFNDFDTLSFSNPAHKAELLAVAPLWVYQAADEESKNEFLSLTRYSNKHKSLVIASLNEMGQIVSYRIRKGVKSKWQARTNAPANAHAYARITEDSGKPIYILEGQHDHLTAILLGIDFIAIPSAGYKPKPEDVELTRGRYLFLIADIDGGAGINAMERYATAADGVARVECIIDIRRFLYSQGIENHTEKIDFSDVVELYGKPNFAYQFEGFCQNELNTLANSKELDDYKYFRI
jgi:hypothetical protein